MTGATIKRLRINAGLSQETLAERIGMGASMVWKWEAGRKPVSKRAAELVRAAVRGDGVEESEFKALMKASPVRVGQRVRQTEGKPLVGTVTAVSPREKVVLVMWDAGASIWTDWTKVEGVGDGE